MRNPLRCLYILVLDNPVNNYDLNGNFFLSGTLGALTGVGIILVGILAIFTICQTANVVKEAIESAPSVDETNNQSVYIMRDEKSYEVQYVGITNDPVRS